MKEREIVWVKLNEEPPVVRPTVLPSEHPRILVNCIHGLRFIPVEVLERNESGAVKVTGTMSGCDGSDQRTLLVEFIPIISDAIEN